METLDQSDPRRRIKHSRPFAVSEHLRAPRFAGRSYPGIASTLAEQLDDYYGHADGSGRPSTHGAAPSPARLRGILSPHIDFQRGGPTYTWAYRALAELSDADVHVIFGVAHQYCESRFVLTRQDFDTPFGRVVTDQNFIDRLTNLCKFSLFVDERVHGPEHSIEFQTVFLKHVRPTGRPVRIVPILVGSFHDLIARGVDPMRDGQVSQFINALQRIGSSPQEDRIVYVGGIDLCHVGPEFGDPAPVSDEKLAEIREFDGRMLAHAAAQDPAGWFSEAAANRNAHRVCGLSATYTMLHAMGPVTGQLLQYRQAVDPSRSCCVSFASMAFTDVEVEKEPESRWS